MDAPWTLVGVGVLATIAGLLRWSLSLWQTRYADLGFVSQQWLSEHRYSESHDERR
jgi:hypothetical protein